MPASPGVVNRKEASGMAGFVAETPQAHASHSSLWGPLGLMLSMAPSVALIVAGILVEGWGRHQLARRDRVGRGRHRRVHAGQPDGPDDGHDSDGPAGP